MTKALKKAEAARRTVPGTNEAHGEVATPKAVKSVRVAGKVIAGAGKEGPAAEVVETKKGKRTITARANVTELAGVLPAEPKAPRPTKYENAADKVLAWAKDHYESKTYAWHRLYETTTKAEIVAELEKLDLSGEKALTHYRRIVKLWADVD